jgi:lipopolysaccharide/colanic/teichoic acid biosynthesis glycosyltransferase
MHSSGELWFELRAAESSQTRNNQHGGSAPMSFLSSSSTSSLGSEAYEPVMIVRDELQWQSSLSLRIAWFLSFVLPYTVKRSMDLAGAFVGLVLLAPVILALSLLIRLDSPGPVLFRQLRRGYRGRLFWLLKFRTMVVDAEQRLDDLEQNNESSGGVLFKLRDDPRVTPLGRFLRRSSLDELPQLINVLRGEMSLVGPRPLQLRDSDKLQDQDHEGYARRLQVMPGLTGPWQVGGRSEVDYATMVKLDVAYAQNWSLTWDLQIILRTFVVVLVGRGAY